MAIRGIIGCLLAGTLLLDACQGVTSADLTRSTHTSGKKAATTAPTVLRSSSEPSPGASSAPLNSPAPKPSIATTLLTGLIKIDANYVISAGGGNVISAGGGNVISAGGGNVISAGGGNVISAGGGNVISAGGGNIISTGGGSVISAGGGNVISAGGGNYRLLDITASAPPLPIGTMLPIKGMAVVPVSLITGKPIGDPVLTDETGTYHLAVPQDTQGNVLVFAAIPASGPDDPRINDPRLRYGALVSPKQGTADAIDEDEALATKYVLMCFTGRLSDVMTKPTREQAAQVVTDILNASALGQIGQLAGDLQTSITDMMLAIRDEADAANIPQDKRPLLAQRIVDAMVSQLDVKSVTVIPLFATDPASQAALSKLKNVNAKENMTYFFEKLRAKVIDKLTTYAKDGRYAFDPAFTDPAGYTIPSSYHIVRPSDLGDYVVREVLAKNSDDKGNFINVDHALIPIFADLGLPEVTLDDGVTKIPTINYVDAIAVSFLYSFAQILKAQLALTAQHKDLPQQIIDQFKQELQAQSQPTS